MDSSLMVRFCCQRLQSVARLFRFVELCIALVFLSWLSTHLPFAVRISGEYFRRFCAFVVSPQSIFLLGNAIVLTLLAKSGLFSSNASLSVGNVVTELCEDFRSDIPDEIARGSEPDEVVFQDKEVICEKKTELVSGTSEFFSENYKRSNSEKLSGSDEEEVKSSNAKLRRSETDICRRDVSGGEEAADEFDFLEDDMSSEEFRRTVEAFIDRQVRFHREECFTVVLHDLA